jgi:glycosyltransferase involved in cell wall biosynthesis
MREKASFRSEPGLPGDQVKCLWATTTVEHVRHRLGCVPSVTFAKLDRRFSLAAAARARKTRSNLFLYSPYAWEAFTARYKHTPRKVLFQFHPHSDLEREILLADRNKYQFIRQSFEDEAGEHLTEAMRRRNRDCWRHADLIICASSFTKQSLIKAGAQKHLCRVVPYGIDVPFNRLEDAAEREDIGISNSFHALFVGAGTQRKGLHHLLLAWRRASLPIDSWMTLVCRVIDPGIETLAKTTRNVKVIRGLDRRELEKMYKTSSLFVMPSLVEGFGQVYLEALAQGCPVLGTSNTCLPDLDQTSGPCIYRVEAGQIDQLTAALECLSRKLPGDIRIREWARSCADNFPWKRFRDGIRSLALE